MQNYSQFDIKQLLLKRKFLTNKIKTFVPKMIERNLKESKRKIQKKYFKFSISLPQRKKTNPVTGLHIRNLNDKLFYFEFSEFLY